MDNGNRIDNRARGNAPQLLEKYKTLARDAQQAGDRVMTEYYLQFADHYFRVVTETRLRQEEAQAQRRQQQGGSHNGGWEREEEPEEEDEFGFRTPASTLQQTHGARHAETSASEERSEGEAAHDFAPRQGVEGEVTSALRPRRERTSSQERVAEEGTTLNLPPAIGLPVREEEPDTASDQPAPRRRGRPRKVVEEAAPVEGD